MDEANSVSCGGRAGISNTFAAALWATSYIAQGMSAGLAGINLQGNPANCFGYSPVCAATAANLAGGLLHPQPLWYALLLTRNLAGDRPVPTRVSVVPGTPAPSATAPTAPSIAPLAPEAGVSSPAPRTGPPNVSVTTLRTPDRSLRFVVVDADPPGSAPATLRLHAGAGYAAASLLPLQASSPEATSAVYLGGRSVAGDGSWASPRNVPLTAPQGGVYAITVAPSSAALVTLPHA
jgi:hypothetical protein